MDTPTRQQILQFGGTKFLQSSGAFENVAGKQYGKHVVIQGPAGVKCWSEPVDAMTKKLVAAGSTHVATVE